MIQYDPLAIFEQNPAKGGVCSIKQVVVGYGAGTNNNSVVAAVTGKFIRCISLKVVSAAAAATSVLFKNGVAGTAIVNAFPVIANNVAIPNGFVYLEPNILGHFDNASGDSVVVDVAAGAGVEINFRYIEVVP